MGGSGSTLDQKSTGGMTLREALNSAHLLVVDVRGSDKAKSENYPGSTNIPISETAFELSTGQLALAQFRDLLRMIRL